MNLRKLIMTVLLMIDCKEASQLLSDQLDNPLPFFKKFLLNFHLALCKACAIVAKQFEGLKKTFTQASDREDILFNNQEKCLSEECCQKMEERIKELIR